MECSTQAIRRYTLPPHAQTEPEDARSTDESWIFDYPHLSELFTQDGKIVPVGTLIKRPAYAQTLESLAQAGADAFYQGDLAQGIVDAVQKAGGLLSMQDLKGMQQSPARLAFLRPLCDCGVTGCAYSVLSCAAMVPQTTAAVIARL